MLSSIALAMFVLIYAILRVYSIPNTDVNEIDYISTIKTLQKEKLRL